MFNLSNFCSSSKWSKLEFSFRSLFKVLLRAVFHFESSNCSLFGYISLNLYFWVLFPASYFIRHIELNIFFEESIHLFFDWIWFTTCDKCSGIIDTRHRVKIFVVTCVAAHHVKFLIENVFSVSSIRNSIVNNQLDQNFLCVITMKT